MANTWIPSFGDYVDHYDPILDRLWPGHKVTDLDLARSRAELDGEIWVPLGELRPRPL